MFSTCIDCRESQRLRMREIRSSQKAEKVEVKVNPVQQYDDEDADLYATPMRTEGCRQFREMMLGMRDKDSVWASNHHVNCITCQVWWSKIYRPQFMGVDLWHSGI